MTTTPLRNASLQDLADMLRTQHGRKIDVVAPAAALSLVEGELLVSGVEPILTDDGVDLADGTFRATAVFDEGLADKLKIPLAYIRRLRAERIDLLDANVNGWLHGTLSNQEADQVHDPRSFYVRLFRGETGTGIARALLSDSYKVIDHLDMLTAVLEGLKQAGVQGEVQRCDLSDRSMFFRIWAPEIEALAPTLLRGYRSPFTGDSAEENPTVFAGICGRNSEVGDGAATLWPELTVRVCTNGMTITKEAVRAVHLGSRQDEGVVQWSEATKRQELKLWSMKARDAAKTFLNVDYMKAKIAELTEMAGGKITKPDATIKHVAKQLSFDNETTEGVLSFFISGGQITAGGVMQAVTAFAQTVDDPDKAWAIGSQGVRAMELAAISR